MRKMVLKKLIELLADRFGCDEEDITLSATLDELNVYDSDRPEIADWAFELYGVEFTSADIAAWETVEDVVGYIEDHME